MKKFVLLGVLFAGVAWSGTYWSFTEQQATTRASPTKATDGVSMYSTGPSISWRTPVTVSAQYAKVQVTALGVDVDAGPGPAFKAGYFRCWQYRNAAWGRCYDQDIVVVADGGSDQNVVSFKDVGPFNILSADDRLLFAAEGVTTTATVADSGWNSMTIELYTTVPNQ